MVLVLLLIIIIIVIVIIYINKIGISEHKTARCTQEIDYAVSGHYAQADHGSPRGGNIINSLLCRKADWMVNKVEPC